MNPVAVRVLLERACLFIEGHPQRHTTGARARDHAGERVRADSAQAVAWDAIGVLLHLSATDAIHDDSAVFDALELMQKVAKARGFLSVRTCNDFGGLEAAVAMFRGSLVLLDEKYPQESVPQ